MKKIILVRHGDYRENDESLTTWGIEDVKNLALQLKKITQGTKVSLFSSPAKRTIESAEIIGKELEIKNEVIEVLFCDGVIKKTKK